LQKYAVKAPLRLSFFTLFWKLATALSQKFSVSIPGNALAPDLFARISRRVAN